MARKVCRDKKRAALKKLQFINEQHTRKSIREMYRQIRWEKIGYQPRLHNIKSRERCLVRMRIS